MHQRLILIVDDDADLREQLVELFHLEGYEVMAVEDGLDALQLLEAGAAPDLVLLDMHMEGIDGDDFAAELRALNVHLRILVITADSHPQDCAARVGANGFLSKPFELSDLLDAVERLLTGQRSIPRWGDGRRAA
jgi:CheY-like chemotaxis protein